MNVAREILHQRRAAFHPVAAVHVLHVADLFHLRAVDVAADHALHLVLTRHLHDGFLVFRDVFHGRLGLGFQIRRQRPVAETEPAAHAIEIQVEIQNPVVEPGADLFQQPIELRQTVELMPVQHEEFFAVRRRVNHLTRNRHAAEIHAEELLQKFVMVPGDVNDLRVLAAFAEEFLDQHIVVVLPVPLGLQLPAVEEIADEIEITALVVAQEIQQGVHLRMLRAEVDVGNPDGTKLLFLRRD